MEPTLVALSVYPIKSCSGNSLSTVSVSPIGLEDDRRFAVVDLHNELLTAREFPVMLGISVGCSPTELLLNYQDQQLSISLPVETDEKIRIRFFKETVTVTELTAEAGQWLSDVIGEACKLVEIDHMPGRYVLPGRGGVDGDRMALADECPILIVSDASLKELNSRLDAAIDMRQFRPNLVITGCDPYFEDSLTSFQLGDVEFEVTQRCKRCDLATIDPDSGIKNARQEPLRTLATYRRNHQGKVTFGVHAIPRSSGAIAVGMPLVI